MATGAVSSSLPLLSSGRCDFLRSYRPSIRSHLLSPLSDFGRIPQWRPSPKLQVSPSRKPPPLWRISAVDSDAAEIIPASDNGSGSIVISALLFTAFIGLALLTVGVIYLAVQDFLQKREREKFEKEESERKKKGGKKKKVRARSGPRGFGQKMEEDDDD